jgi:LPXTG-motif cell wall-anchored protein
VVEASTVVHAAPVAQALPSTGSSPAVTLALAAAALTFGAGMLLVVRRHAG